MNDKAKVAPRQLARGAGLVAVFFISFVSFLFFTFPYEVLKETISGEISQSTGYNIQIGDMTSAFPLGIKAKKITLEAPGGGRLVLDQAKVRVSILAFLIGRISVSADVTSKNGEINLSGALNLFDLIRGVYLPRWVSLDAWEFPLDDCVGFLLNSMSNSPTANPMVAPLLSAIGVRGLLSGNIEFTFDSKNPVQSTGKAEISLKNAMLELSDPTLGLPDQLFKKALLKAKVESGSLVLDKVSGFIAEEVEILPSGKITLKPQMPQSLLDMRVELKLNGGLKEKFGFIIDAVTGTATGDGRLTTQLRGPIAAPAVTTF
jgi:hypothetical protein